MKIPPLLAGFLGFAGLLLFYLIVLSALNSPAHALSEFAGMWYWILLLAIGFGVQVGLVVYARSMIKGAAVSGGVSGLAMVACCAHHLTDVLPLVGLAAFSVFLVRYQIAFIVLGLASNVIGIAFIMREMQRHAGMHGLKGNFEWIFQKMDFGAVLSVTVVASAAVVLVVFIAAFQGMI